MSDMFKDLLNFASDHLSKEGRLVFWLPVDREEYSEEKLPQHPNLRHFANCEQVLSTHISRRLIVMEKRKKPLDDVVSEKAAASADLVPASSSAFREQFYFGAAQMGKKERKERVKKYGHLNMKGNPPIEEKKPQK